MFHATLEKLVGAGANKGKPNVVEITSAKMQKDGVSIKFGKTITDDQGNAIQYEDAKGGKSDKVGILASLFSYPQFGPEPGKNDKGEYVPLTDDQARSGVEEAIADSGGVVRFLENYNDATRTAALNRGKNFIRTKEDGEPDKIVEEGLRLSRDFSWAQAERVTNATVRQNAEKLVDEMDQLSDEELRARMKAMFAKKG